MNANEKDNVYENLTEEDIAVSKELSYVYKNELIYCDSKTLIDLYNSKEDYYKFLGLNSILVNEDPGFLAFLTLAIDNILDVINYSRYKYKTTGEVNLLENEIIVRLNMLNQSATEEFKEEYKEFQREVRMCNFETDEEILRSMAYDTIVIKALTEGDLSKLDTKKFISSTSYLLEDYSILYKNNKEYIDMTIDKLSDIKLDSDKHQKKKIKIIEKQINKI